MFKKTALSLCCALALSATAVSAFAATKFYLVVPVPSRAQAQEPVETITVSLAGAALPKATVNQAYSESLRPYLSVTGDSAFDAAAARWSVAEGTLPAGLSLNETTGAVAGTPTAKTTTPANFKISAAYKGQDGQALYVLEVGGRILKARAIASGGNHTCAITDIGGVQCWGSNAYGQLGSYPGTPSLIPVDVLNLGSTVVGISAGGLHTCAVLATGAAKCWGSNYAGQLGAGNPGIYYTPLQVSGLTAGVTQISAGNSYTCAVVSGAAMCWGRNDSGQLGNGTTANTSTPVSVTGLDSGVETISAMSEHTCAIQNGSAKCWGTNYQGAIGHGDLYSATPAQVLGLTAGVSAITVGDTNSCAVHNGAAKCWGANWSGELGTGLTESAYGPVQVAGLSAGVSTIMANSNYVCAVHDGAAKCWGDNRKGQLGNGTNTSAKSPVQVSGLTSGIVSVAPGQNHSCALTSEGTVMCWGGNELGQLGVDSTTNSTQPMAVQ